MARCNFCGHVIEKGTGKMFVKDDGKILFFCSGKCEKNLIKLKRNPRKITWTKEYQQVKKARKTSEQNVQKTSSSSAKETK